MARPLEHSFLWPLPLYRAIIMSSFWWAGTWPKDHTWRNSSCNAILIGVIAYFSSRIPSGPAARPWSRFLIAVRTSGSVRASDDIDEKSYDVDDSFSTHWREAECIRLILAIYVGSRTGWKMQIRLLSIYRSCLGYGVSRVTVWYAVNFEVQRYNTLGSTFCYLWFIS